MQRQLSGIFARFSPTFCSLATSDRTSQDVHRGRRVRGDNRDGNTIVFTLPIILYRVSIYKNS